MQGLAAIQLLCGGKTVPKRTDMEKIMIIGSGPIVIGQACEFDYSGTQATKALRKEGYEVVLVNSNPATIMTDPELSSRVYVEPLVPSIVAKIIERERPDALLSTVGGQTALNLAVELAETGVLDRFGVELIGADLETIKLAEDRLLFREAVIEAGWKSHAAALCRVSRGPFSLPKTSGTPLSRAHPSLWVAREGASLIRVRS